MSKFFGNFQKGGLAEGQKKGGVGKKGGGGDQKKGGGVTHFELLDEKIGLIFLKFSPAAAFHIIIKPILCTLNYKKQFYNT